MPEVKEKDLILVTDFEGVVHIVSKEEQQAQKRAANGCAMICIVIFLGAIICGLVFLTVDQYKKNKRHPNVISGIYEKDKRIIISDVYTKEERMIKYDDINVDGLPPLNIKHTPTFQEKITHSQVGDTVMFVSPWYKERVVFDLGAKSGHKNSLILNMDSINSRMSAAQYKQDMNELLNQKQR